jgi:FtsP/CotA-like multicopper oxidase with cupredoxin domain
MRISRREFLATTAAAGVVSATPSLLFPQAARAWAGSEPATILRIEKRVIDVLGKGADVFGIVQPDGTPGLHAEAGKRFRVRLENRAGEETLIHWHGLTPPWKQDGVPNLSQAPLSPGESYDYDFPLTRAGTNWMHSHHGLQEQRLMAAPLIVRDPTEVAADIQDVVVMFHDFTFRDPNEILAELKHGGHGGAHGASTAPAQAASSPAMPMGHGGMDHGAMGHGTSSMPAVHLHDVEYDAFLANDRTLDDPAVFRVERGGRVRLRLINAATATQFWLDLDRLQGRLIAVDGVPVEPITGSRFEFAIAQRFDILLDLPHEQGAWPVSAVREGDTKRTGFVLATEGGVIARQTGDAAHRADAVGLQLERRLRAAAPLPQRTADRRHTVTITEAPGYVWMLNGAVHGAHKPVAVRAGERVEITFVDQTTMAHPMHLHGHHFQVVAINGQRFPGAVRDTVLVPAKGSVTVAFDANNPGKWALHCHHLYHMAAGMMTTLEYDT